VEIKRDCVQCLADDAPAHDTHLAWGLGWGIDMERGTAVHWGDNGPFKAMTVGSPRDASAFIIFANSENGMAVMPALFAKLGTPSHPLFGWLRYWR
jgi:hypothetical protein